MTDKSVAQGSLIAILPKQGNLTKTAWELPTAMTEGEWQAAGNALSQVDGAMNWWLGDWWRFGEHKYGDRKALVESDEWTGPVFGTCMNAATVCAKFQTSRRREVVPFSHHAECASIPDAEADRIIEWCESEYNKTGRVPTRVVLREKVKQVKAWLAQGWTQSQLPENSIATTPASPAMPSICLMGIPTHGDDLAGAAVPEFYSKVGGMGVDRRGGRGYNSLAVLATARTGVDSPMHVRRVAPYRCFFYARLNHPNGGLRGEASRLAGVLTGRSVNLTYPVASCLTAVSGGLQIQLGVPL